MNAIVLLLKFISAPALLFLSVLAAEEYSETATLTYLPNNNLLSDVNFKLKSIRNSANSANSIDSVDLGIFPSLIHGLVSEFGLLEGKISFTRGIWDSGRWSKAPNNPTSSGFQFHGHFSNVHQLGIEERFNQAIEMISGYFCASLNILKYSNAIKPTIPSFSGHNLETSVLVGIIPSEPVCIENLQPFLDLLPCSNRAGLAEMFKQEAIYQSDFHSIEVEFTSSDVSAGKMELNLRMITVYDLNRWDRNNAWSLTSLFGKGFKKSCPFNDPKIVLRIPNNEFLNSLHHQKEKVYALENHLEIFYTETEFFNEIGASNIPKLYSAIDKSDPFRAFRFKSGTDDNFGGFGLVLENDSIEPLEVTVIESIPWLFRVFLHEAEFALNSEPIPPANLSHYLKEFSIELAITRKRNLLLQSKWRIPAQSKIQIYFPFEREFLRVDEFPPNSERGIELPGALIYCFGSDSGDSDIISSQSSHTTNTLLYTWPIPDVTMPFNVITMTSTLSALFFGSFFNLIIRKFYLKRPNDPPAGLLPKFIWKLKNAFTK